MASAAAKAKRPGGGRTRRQAVSGDGSTKGPAVLAVADADEVFERGELWHRRGCPAMEHRPGETYYVDESEVPEHWHREPVPDDSEYAGLVAVPSRVDLYDGISPGPPASRVRTVRCNDCGEQVTTETED